MRKVEKSESLLSRSSLFDDAFVHCCNNKKRKEKKRKEPNGKEIGKFYLSITIYHSFRFLLPDFMTQPKSKLIDDDIIRLNHIN